MILALALSSAAVVRGDETASDPDLPQAFDPATALAPLASNSPFNRVVNFATTYVLTGVAYVDGKPLATILNKDTKQRFVVTEQPNAQGWRLASAKPTADPKQTGITVLVGGEEVSLTYNATEIPTEHKSSNSWTSRRREVTPVDIHSLPESEIIRKDKDGKPYVRGSIYLPTADREKYYNEMPREAHEKFLQIIQDNRERMFRYTPDQRASFSKKVFDSVMESSKNGNR